MGKWHGEVMKSFSSRRYQQEEKQHRERLLIIIIIRVDVCGKFVVYSLAGVNAKTLGKQQ